MTDKYDAYLYRILIWLTIGFALTTAGAGLIHYFFGDVDLRIILIPLWLVGLYFMLKYMYYFVKSFFSTGDDEH